ncbi:hypothetical protein KH5H1_65070 [Corallococcus caeni]|uniref:hypothetical protein n=1 Tax=Corallococcus caeni TaxID=3082388 RepID=UPI002956B9E0|nr:hypothetical protein KH5H1_65070 [Corallococcus sp. KH5-1]
MLSAMKGTTVRREELDAGTRARMLALMQCCYVGVSAERFHADLDAKQWVFLLHARRTRELVGFSTVRVAEEDGVEVLYSGDTVIHPDWWGHKTLQVVFGRLLLARKLRRPWRPLYWLLLSGGYKTYLLAVNYFPRTHPRRDWTPPEGRSEFLRGLATRWFGTQYDAAKGTLCFDGEHYRVRDGVSPIDRDAAAHPHIAYFAERNPGHAEGEELVCLVEIRGWDLARALARSVWGQLRRWSRRERDASRIRVGT